MRRPNTFPTTYYHRLQALFHRFGSKRASTQRRAVESTHGEGMSLNSPLAATRRVAHIATHCITSSPSFATACHVAHVIARHAATRAARACTHAAAWAMATAAVVVTAQAATPGVTTTVPPTAPAAFGSAQLGLPQVVVTGPWATARSFTDMAGDALAGPRPGRQLTATLPEQAGFWGGSWGDAAGVGGGIPAAGWPWGVPNGAPSMSGAMLWADATVGEARARPVAGGAVWRTGRSRWQLPVPPGSRLVRDLDLPERPWQPGHRGIDLGHPPGAVLTAPADGRVIVAQEVAGRPVVTLLHADGHRSSLDPAIATVAVGTVVAVGAPIAVVAQSVGHCAEAACVHWGVRDGDDYVDPLDRGPVRVRLLPTPP